MTKITVHKELIAKPVQASPDWPGFKEELLIDPDYSTVVGTTQKPALAARLESMAMLDSDNWPLFVHVWNQVIEGLTITSTAPPKWNTMAKTYNIPLAWDASGKMSLATE